MDELVTLISTPGWWVSTVIVAFVVNIAAGYSKPWIDFRWANWSEKRRNALAEKNRQDDAVVWLLIENRTRMVDARTDATFTLLRVILALMAAIFWSSIANFFRTYGNLPELLVLGCVAVIYLYFTILSLQHFRRYRGLRRIIDKCSDSVYSYDQMPVDVAEALRREDQMDSEE